MELRITDLLDLSHTMAGEYLSGFSYPWEALDGIKELIISFRKVQLQAILYVI